MVFNVMMHYEIVSKQRSVAIYTVTTGESTVYGPNGALWFTSQCSKVYKLLQSQLSIAKGLIELADYTMVRRNTHIHTVYPSISLCVVYASFHMTIVFTSIIMR